MALTVKLGEADYVVTDDRITRSLVSEPNGYEQYKLTAWKLTI